MVEKEYILKETARRIIDSPRTKEQMLNMLESVPTISNDEIKQTNYCDCYNALLYLWVNNFVVDGEYNKILKRLNDRVKEEKKE